jgi:long-subunit acyl-CoA synthetase (AMP-forming)
MRRDVFFNALSHHAENPALNDGVHQWTYSELERQIHLWIDRLREVRADRVAYRLPNGCNWIALDLALLETGRVAVPIPGFFSLRQERHVLECSGVDTYVVEPHHDAQGFAAVTSAPAFRVLRSRARRFQPVHPDTAKITFTSGTTGQPKGVCLSATHMLATAAAIERSLGAVPGWRHLCALPLSLLLENVAGVYANLFSAHEICVPPLDEIGVTGSSGLDVARFIAAQHRFRPQSIILVPQLLLALTAAAEFGVALPDTYRFVAVGGATVPVSLITRARRVGLPAFEGYGLTECGSVVALNLPNANRPGTVGRPLDNAEIEVVDGDIHVGGSTMLGYLGDSAPASGRIATGDVGTFDADGYLRVLGRRRNNFITSFGRNVSPEWIEGELHAEFAIACAAVFGESLPRAVALVVARGVSDHAAVQAAIDAANARLPDYARVAVWRAIPMAEFAEAGCLTENGRPRRDVIVSRYRNVLDDMYLQLEEQFDATVRQA